MMRATWTAAARHAMSTLAAIVIVWLMLMWVWTMRGRCLGASSGSCLLPFAGRNGPGCCYRHLNGGVVEEMQRLFRSAGPEMTEEKELHFLVQVLFACGIRNSIPPVSAADSASEAVAMENVLEMRMRHYDRPENAPITEGATGWL